MARGSFSTRDRRVAHTSYAIHRLDRVDGASRLPHSLKMPFDQLAGNRYSLVRVWQHG